MILAIETSTPVCSVAIAKDKENITEKRKVGKGVHSEYTFMFIHELLDLYHIDVSDLEAVLFSNGPGSYTGLRIGASGIKGLLFDQNVSLYTLPTLLSVAVPFLEAEYKTIHSVIDARRQHLYYQKIIKKNENVLEVSSPEIKQITDLERELNDDEMLAGTGWERMNRELRNGVNCAGEEAISAKNLLLAWYHILVKPYFKKTDVERFEPDYLTMSQLNNTIVD